jgi:two-component system KDP operon response regulator KdpE
MTTERKGPTTSQQAPTVLVVEDEAPIRHFLRTTLSAHGFRVVEATTGRDGIAEAAARTPDLIVLDLGLPDVNGLEVTRQLREWTSVPIIVLSARNQEQDKVAALDLGADDYVTKPFGVGELLARMRVALRHTARSNGDAGETAFTCGELRVDLVRRSVFVGDREIHLTPIEYKLLTILVRHAGKVLTHRQLLQEVWGPHHTQDSHYVRIYIRQLRNKLEPNPAHPRYLLTELGVGYRLRTDEDVRNQVTATPKPAGP